jgi:hypothetical protein
MSDPVIGYRNTGKDSWEPITQPRGGIYTAAMLMCSDCKHFISGHGGPGSRNGTLCPTCFDKFKLVNFAEGNDPIC